MKQQREKWKSRFGFVWAAVGSSVGLGSIWLFPYQVGQHGGAAYIFIYLIALFFVGFPTLLSELIVGRTSSQNPANAFFLLGKRKIWKKIGFGTILTGFLVSGFYAVVASWTLGYLVQSLTGGLREIVSPSDASANFTSLVKGIPLSISCLIGFLLLTTGALYTGVQKGIERTSQIAMPILVFLLLFLAIQGLLMPGASQSIRFMFQPHFSMLTPHSFLLALGQAFFSLSLGQGTMVTYGSYLKKKTNLPGTCLPVALTGVFIALLAGVAIFSIVFSFDLSPSKGEGLMFETLPILFSKMKMGALLAPLFFCLLLLAGLTSQISAMEPLIAYLIDVKQWSRRKSVLFTSGTVFFVALFASLSLRGKGGSTFLDQHVLFDFLVFLCLNVLIPLGGLSVLLLVGWWWGMDRALEHMEEGAEGLFVNYPFLRTYFRIFIKVIAPMAILWILFDGLRIH